MIIYNEINAATPPSDHYTKNNLIDMFYDCVYVPTTKYHKTKIKVIAIRYEQKNSDRHSKHQNQSDRQKT